MTKTRDPEDSYLETSVIRRIHRQLNYSNVHIPLSSLPDKFLEMYQVNIDPDYQRDHVWTNEQAQKFVGFFLEGGETGVILINCPPDKGETAYEVVDGKQRLTSLIRWMRDEFPAILSDGTKLWRRDLDGNPVDKRALSTVLMAKVGLLKLTRLEVLDLYLKLNRGGTVHTDEEINKVRKLLLKEQKKHVKG